MIALDQPVGGVRDTAQGDLAMLWAARLPRMRRSMQPTTLDSLAYDVCHMELDNAASKAASKCLLSRCSDQGTKEDSQGAAASHIVRSRHRVLSGVWSLVAASVPSGTSLQINMAQLGVAAANMAVDPAWWQAATSLVGESSGSPTSMDHLATAALCTAADGAQLWAAAELKPGEL